ncbi:RNA polymerase sigma factor SigI [Paenibacillus alkalitolerans]|uniref:RNA polymerase sigma factor SigI n=1 Tax=Paenibacillus alkalitolerans TaxID=2799335 RepID=UPI0018F5770C|nr:RNA polymerase sigma factor SigI [Paenibacillus alkalitolerans]
MILLLIKRWFSGRDSLSQVTERHDLEAAIERIQAGDEVLRNDVIRQYQPFIAKTAGQFCKRYIQPDADEFSIALAAFNEAINGFDVKAGRSFLGFAEGVIRRRLIDHVRREQRFAVQIPQSAFEIENDDDEHFDPIDAKEAVQRYERDQAADERRLEIETLSSQLADFGITFADLVDSSPKHEDSRRMLIGIGALLSRHPELSATMLAKKSLPLKELTELVDVSRKTLERGRKYIIAVTLIYLGSFPHLKSFVLGGANEDENASQQHGEWGA